MSYPSSVLSLKAAGKSILLACAAFALAFVVGLTPVTHTYVLAVAVSVIFCPLALGFFGARVLKSSLTATLVGVNALPVASALDDMFHLRESVHLQWIIASILLTWAGWKLGRDGRGAFMAK